MALRVGCWGRCFTFDLYRNYSIFQMGDGFDYYENAEQVVAFGLPSCIEQAIQNWNGRRESDCLIKTKYCDYFKWTLHNVISAQCSEC